MSNGIINTRSPAPFQQAMALQSWRSLDYYENGPYPTHAFGPQQWQLDKGPTPTPLPYAQILITEGAEFVFRGGPPVFSVAENAAANDRLQAIIRANNLNAQWVSLAENAANHGAIFAKFSVDMDNKANPVRITFLTMPQECRVWVNPHDHTRILMARIQYPFRDPASGDWMYYREEWTDEFYVKYRPKWAGKSEIGSVFALPDYRNSLGDGDGWEIEQQDANPFGLIPGVVIRNRMAKGNPLGVGDCWRVFGLIDRIALTMHGEDTSNQLHSDPTLAVSNGELENKDPLQPGEVFEVKGKKDAGPVKVELLEPSGAAREYSHRDIDKWEELLYKAVGLSRVNPADVTNSGNMTELAFAMTYGRSIATSDSKRELWGNSGMCVFFHALLTALHRLGGVRELAAYDEDAPISVEWPPYFQVTPDDLETITDRTATQVEKGFLPIDRGAERIARAEKIPANEIQTLLAELKAERAAKAASLAAQSVPDGGDSDDGDTDESGTADYALPLAA